MFRLYISSKRLINVDIIVIVIIFLRQFVNYFLFLNDSYRREVGRFDHLTVYCTHNIAIDKKYFSSDASMFNVPNKVLIT